MEHKSPRSERFAALLAQPSPDTIRLMVGMEKTVRLLRHVFQLTGDVDEKLFASLMGVSERIQEAYEETGT